MIGLLTTGIFLRKKVNSLVSLNGDRKLTIDKREQQKEYRTVSYLVSTLVNICAAPPNMIIDKLTGFLWDAEEAGQIKRANMPEIED